MIESESGDRQSQTRLFFCWKSVEILVVNPSSTLFLFPLQARKENQNLRNFNITPLLEIQLSDIQLTAAGLKSVGVEWARSDSWDAKLTAKGVKLIPSLPPSEGYSNLIYAN